LARRRRSGVDRSAESLLKEIFGLDQGVRFAALFDWKGRKIAGGMRRGTKSLDPPKKASHIDRATARYPILLASNKQYFGDFEFMYAKMKRLGAIVVQAGPGRVLVVTTNPPVGFDLIPGITRVVREAQSLK